MKNLLFFFLLTLFFQSSAQQLTLVTELSDSLKETSGLLRINQRVITHNDSGNAPELYEVDTLNGTILRKVVLENTINVDWEDITSDDQYIYIGDFGNNSGARTDLKIYKISIQDYLNTPNDSVSTEIIQFSYADQIDFSPSPFATNFDAEALISIDDSLYIFTKNWIDNHSNIYAISKTPGNYSVNKIDSVNPQGYITGADYNTSTNTILLSGYTFSSAFLIKISAFSGNDFSNGTLSRYDLTLPSGFSYQTEGISYLNENNLYISSEIGQDGASGLYSLQLSSFVGLQSNNKEDFVVYPNPVHHKLNIQGDFESAELYDLNGTLVLKTKKDSFCIRKLDPGTYSLYVYSLKRMYVKKIVIQ